MRPADYIDTVNTAALPRYARKETMQFDKSVRMESQMNVLPWWTSPRALFSAKAVSWTGVYSASARPNE
jgi:Phage major capsid protein E